MDQKQDPKKVEIKGRRSGRARQYASLAAIRHSREEFLFDFAFLFPMVRSASSSRGSSSARPTPSASSKPCRRTSTL